MSLLKRLGRGIERGFKKVISSPLLQGAITTAFPQSKPFMAAAAAIGRLPSRPAAVPPGGASRAAIPRNTAYSGATRMSLALPALPALGTVARTVGGAVRQYGGTAATVGMAGAMLYDAMGNPVRRKRPRSKGITARELKSFTRVTGLLNKYCKTPAPTKRRNAPRGKACR